jgi:YGGT family
MTDYQRTTVRESETDPAPPPYDDRVRTTETAYRGGPTAGEMIRRVVMLLFGILQALLILRIVLLLLIANQSNEIVAAILNFTDIFVEPFRGMFRLDKVGSNQGSVLDVAAVVALIGWTLIEAAVIAVLSIGARRGEDATSA